MARGLPRYICMWTRDGNPAMAPRPRAGPDCPEVPEVRAREPGCLARSLPTWVGTGLYLSWVVSGTDWTPAYVTAEP